MSASFSDPKPAVKSPRPSAGQILSLPPKWLASYEEFITKNAGQVSQIESALRSLTYIIPGRCEYGCFPYIPILTLSC